MELIGGFRPKVIRYIATGILLLIASHATQAGTIDAAEFCVTDTEMQFSIDITSANVDTGDVRLAAYADARWLGGSTEYFGLNMDRDCQITRGVPPTVFDSGTPTLDRFQNGIISNYTLTSLGVGQCRFAGSIPHGANPFVAGDTMADVFYREFNPYIDAHAFDVVLSDCVVASSYTVGGNISGLNGTVTLQNNGGDDLAVDAEGPFTFVTALPDGSAYAVTVSTQPTGQTCTVTNGSGAIATADVTNVAVDCVDDVVVIPPTPAMPVPTLSQWALIMLSMFLGLMVFANRRRLF